MTNDLDLKRHIFGSPEFQGIVDEAIRFFTESPICSLPPPTGFNATGGYGL